MTRSYIECLSMTLLRIYSSGFLIIIVGTGCAMIPRQSALPMVGPSKLLERPGFKVLSPRGEKWFIASSVPSVTSDIILIKRVKSGVPQTDPLITPSSIVQEMKNLTPRQVLYNLLGMSENSSPYIQTVTAMVITLKLEDRRFDTPREFKEFVEENLNKESSSSSSLTVGEFNVSLHEALGPFCVKYEIVAEDNRVPQYPGKVFVLILEGYRCLHPHWPSYLIDVGYSQRYLREQGRVLIEGEVRPFLRSFEFTEDRPVTVE